MPVWKVTEEESGQRLSAFLKKKVGTSYSARQIKQAIEQNACSLNERVEHFASTVVGKGDRIVFEPPSFHQDKILAAEVLYEDDDLIALSKPPGISSEDSNLLPSPGASLLHRLDKDTSGVLLWGKERAAVTALLEAFKKREIKKTYLAIVDKIPSKRQGHIENYLVRGHQYHGQSLWKSQKSPGGLLAITDWEIEEALNNSALLRCFPFTGRTHQIRVHLSEMGFPVLGDKQYGRAFLSSYKPSRCLLHAHKVSFFHPRTGEKLEIIAPIPKDFKMALEILRT